MNTELVKSLEQVIDETIAEIEELKKSDRFSAAEVKLEGPDGKLDGHDANGSMEKKEEEKKDHDESKEHDDEDDHDDDDMDKAEMHKMKHAYHMKKAEDCKDDKKKHSEHMEKAEHHKKKADEHKSSHWHMEKAEQALGKAEECKKDETKKSEHEKHMQKHKHHMKKALDCYKMEKGVNEQADPDRGHHKMDKGEGVNSKADPDKGHHKMDKGEKALAKSEGEVLFKSYVDEKVGGLEEKINTVLTMVKEIAETPVPAKGQTYKVQPLKKSEETEQLSKTGLVEKLFELKKSGKPVDTADIAAAELSGPADLQKIANKYNLA